MSETSMACGWMTLVRDMDEDVDTSNRRADDLLDVWVVHSVSMRAEDKPE